MIEILVSSVRLSTPLIFAAMGGLIAERSGIATICLEGVLLVSAWVAAVVTYYTHEPALGVVCACLAGSVSMMLHAFLSITARSDQIISGVAVNIFAAGLTPLFSKVFFGTSGNSPMLSFQERLGIMPIPWLQNIPVLGKLFFEQPWLIYMALTLPIAIHLILYKTTQGLRVLASGDGPEALESVGVSPIRVRYRALAIAGIFVSFGGSYLSISHASSFIRDMTSGRGFIALTALIFGNWRPLPTLFACLFFGFTDALQIQLQSTPIFGVILPVQFVQVAPYFVTLLVLLGFVRGARAPLSIGKR